MRFSCGNSSESFASRSDSGLEIGDHREPRGRPKARLNQSKGDDPLSDPQVRRTLIELNITRAQLIEMSVKELNKRLVHCSASLIDMLKRCRRTLKNRGYAKSCRVKRIAAKYQLEQINKRLARENRELKQRNRSLAEQIIQLQQNQSAAKSTISSSLSPQTTMVVNQENFIEQQPLSRYDQQQQPTNSCASSHQQQVSVRTLAIKREQVPPAPAPVPVAEPDPEMLPLYECVDTYPSGVDLEQIAQSISDDASFLHIWNI